MKITQAFTDDHRLIVRLLACLEKAAELLENGKEIRPGYFTDIITFNKGYIGNIHQKAEETVLFEAMVKHGLPKKDRLLTIAILEHEQSQLYIRRMRSAVERWQSGNHNASQEVISNALGFVSLLRQHIQDEDNKIYPRAKKIIPEIEQPNVMEAYDRFMKKSIDQGIREKFIKMVSVLETEIA